MNLSAEQIKSIAKGIAEAHEVDGAVQLCRFTGEQAGFYYGRENKENYLKSFATAGVRLEFYTDSRSLAFELDVSKADTNLWFRHDLYVNGEHKMTMEGNLKDYPDMKAQISRSLELGAGEKHIALYLPWTAATKIISVTLDDGASVMPVQLERKMVVYGDSVTHGAFAKDSSKTYVVQAAAFLNAEAINKGLGGDVMRPVFAAIPDPEEPDLVIVSYGTNDWTSKSRESFDRDSEEFYANIRTSYPNSKMFVISPIWRKDWEKDRASGSFLRISEKLRMLAEALPDVTCIDGWTLVSHDMEMFSPDGLHPNEQGFAQYAKNLSTEIKKYL